MPIADHILGSPSLVSILLVLLAASVGVSKLAGPAPATHLERVRGPVWRLLHPLAARAGRPLVRDKTHHDEYVLTVENVLTVESTLQELLRALDRAGWSYNPVSTKKYRAALGEPVQWSVATWVFRPSMRSKWQYHAYVFRCGRAELDVHMHKEINLLYSPRGHVSGPQYAGDVDGHLRDALEAQDIGYRQRPYAPPG